MTIVIQSYLTIQTCFENREKFEALMELLKALIETLDVNRTQKFMGLKRVAMDLADQSLLDYPEAKDMYIRALDRGAANGWISEGSRNGLIELVEPQGSTGSTAQPRSVNEFKSMCRSMIVEYFENSRRHNL